MTRITLPTFELDCVSRDNRTFVAVDSLQDYFEAVAQVCESEDAEFTARMLRALRAQLEIGARMAWPQ